MDQLRMKELGMKSPKRDKFFNYLIYNCLIFHSFHAHPVS